MIGQEIGIGEKTGTETATGIEAYDICLLSSHCVLVFTGCSLCCIPSHSTEDSTVIMLRNMREAVMKEDVRLNANLLSIIPLM